MAVTGAAALAVLAFGLGATLLDPRSPAQADARVVDLPLPELNQTAKLESDRIPEHPSPESKAVDGLATADWVRVEVQRGQTMERIFGELGLSARVLHQVVHADAQTGRLARIRPGDPFAFLFDAEGNLLKLQAEHDEQHWLIVERNDDGGWGSRLLARQLDTRIVEASAEIRSSLFNAAKDAGLSDNMTMRLAGIFGWDIDFALDIRAGDHFALVYEEIWRDGQFLRDGAILAARFVNQGEGFEAIRFDAGNGPDYFAPDGRPMRKAFLRAPLNFSRVTSNFNPRRFHPVTRRVRPHNGTDYGAAPGTPVWASGDGKVIESAYNSVNGHYVFIQHGERFVTRYLHLSRREVQRGQRVRQGQTIGRVGATGLATGPHLHYEFLVNGVHRNPRTVDLPPAEPLPDELIDRFRTHGRGLLARLQALDETRLLVALGEEDCLVSSC